MRLSAGTCLLSDGPDPSSVGVFELWFNRQCITRAIARGPSEEWAQYGPGRVRIRSESAQLSGRPEGQLYRNSLPEVRSPLTAQSQPCGTFSRIAGASGLPVFVTAKYSKPDATITSIESVRALAVKLPVRPVFGKRPAPPKARIPPAPVFPRRLSARRSLV